MRQLSVGQEINHVCHDTHPAWIYVLVRRRTDEDDCESPDSLFIDVRDVLKIAGGPHWGHREKDGKCHGK